MSSPLAFAIGVRGPILSRATADETTTSDDFFGFEWLSDVAESHIVIGAQFSPYDFCLLERTLPRLKIPRAAMDIERLANLEVFVDIIDPAWRTALASIAPANVSKCADLWRAEFEKEEDDPPAWSHDEALVVVQALVSLCAVPSASELIMIWCL
ncbi:MAG: hypothetical protein Q8O67_20945 [Deltaproteobacteria bacterium]|nr:hypothetical protein [Deltaproteobacteria bacterium]